VAKEKMICVFSRDLCRECALFRGRHYYLCFAPQYRGRLPKDACRSGREAPPASGSPWFERFFRPDPVRSLGPSDLLRIRERIDLDYTTADFVRETFERLSGRRSEKTHDRYFLHIDVWGCKAVLCLVDTRDGGSAQPVEIGVPQSLLEDAVFDAGGALLMAGHYPLSVEVRRFVEKKLGLSGEGHKQVRES
jgi:hypothetical protein